MLRFSKLLWFLTCLSWTCLAALHSNNIRADDSATANTTVNRDATETHIDEPRTGELLKHLSLQNAIAWQAVSGGGHWVDFDEDTWDGAVKTVRAAKKAKRELQERKLRARGKQRISRSTELISGESENVLSARALFKRSSNTVPHGVQASETKNGPTKGKHNFFSCKNAGEIGFDNTIAAFALTGCPLLTLLAEKGVRVYVGETVTDAQHNTETTYYTWRKFKTDAKSVLKYFATGECVFLVTWLTTYMCQKDNDSGTQGGTLTIYNNDVSSSSNGAKTDEVTIDPNRCSDATYKSNIVCTNPITNNLPDYQPVSKNGDRPGAT